LKQIESINEGVLEPQNSEIIKNCFIANKYIVRYINSVKGYVDPHFINQILPPTHIVDKIELNFCKNLDEKNTAIIRAAIIFLNEIALSDTDDLKNPFESLITLLEVRFQQIKNYLICFLDSPYTNLRERTGLLLVNLFN